MSLSEEDRQIIALLDKKDKEQVLDLTKEVHVLYEILSHLESISTELESISIEEQDRKYLKEIMFKLYNRRDLLEGEIYKILNNFWENVIRKAKRKRKLIYKKFGR